MGFRDYVRAGLASFGKIPSGQYGMGFGWGGLQSSGRDWSAEAGARFDNSIVYAAIMYLTNAMSEVDVYVRRKKSDGTYEEIPNHPVTELLNNPNPWYDWSTMLSGCIISEVCGRGGSSYLYKHRSQGSLIIGLEYIPHYAVRPVTKQGTPQFIDYYALTIAGGIVQVPVEDMIQQRYGPMNPMFPQESFGPIEAALMEVVTDKQAANFTAALIRNVGVTPHLISPALKDVDGTEIVFNREQREQIAQVWEEKITGDNRGKPLISPIPIKVDNLSFSPSDMNLEAIRNITEERICAALRIPPGVLNLGTGLENSNNRASHESTARQAARDCIKPYMKRKGQQLTRALIPELGNEGEEIAFRVDAIEALQDDKSETAKRLTTACGGAYMTVNEARAKEGLSPIDGGDDIRSASAQLNNFDERKTNQ